jgi:hypothetical protein
MAKSGFAEKIPAEQRALKIAMEKNITVFIYFYQEQYRLSSVGVKEYLLHRPSAKFISQITAAPPRKI